MNIQTKVVLLGTGTPNSDPDRSGPSVAVVVGSRAYLVDCGPGVVRRATQAYRAGIEPLRSNNLSRLFVTHLHSDHTGGYADVILTPWVLERDEPLQVFGPKGMQHMTTCLLDAYQADIAERLSGLEQANQTGIQVQVQEIEPGMVYQDELVSVTAIPVIHGKFDAYAFRFVTPDKTIVISGDTYPCDALTQAAAGCDILVHEAYDTEGVKSRAPHWRQYHTSVHTSALELGKLAQIAQPKQVVLYHQLYMIDINTYTPDLADRMAEIEQRMIADVQQHYTGPVFCAKDLDVF